MQARPWILDDTDVVLEHRGSHTGEGSGRRVLRHWADHVRCCDAPQIVTIADGRSRCHTCGTWYSASHSGPWTAGARSARPVGIDIQVRRDRPAAMRWLAQTCSLTRPTLAHWVATEAVLKAAGQAHGLSWLTSFPLPDDLPQSSTVVLPGTGPATVVWGTWENTYLAVAVIHNSTTSPVVNDSTTGAVANNSTTVAAVDDRTTSPALNGTSTGPVVDDRTFRQSQSPRG